MMFLCVFGVLHDVFTICLGFPCCVYDLLGFAWFVYGLLRFCMILSSVFLVGDRILKNDSSDLRFMVCLGFA